MPDADGILRHIRHAEEWLRWARGDCRRGDVRSAVLRLLLAEAEIRHAREAGMSTVPRPAGSGRLRRVPAVALGAAAALVIVAAGYAVLRPGPLPAPVADSGSAPATVPGRAGVRVAAAAEGPLGIVRLESGRLLTTAPALPDPEQDRSGSTAAPWGALLDGRFLDGPARRSRYAGPVQLGEPASLIAPADSDHLSSTF